MRWQVTPGQLTSDWFLDLSHKHKILWFFLNTHCDAAGVWVVNYRLATMVVGERVMDRDLSAFGEQVKRLGKDKILIRSFIETQAGELNPNNSFHKHILRLISIHGLTDKDLHTRGVDPHLMGCDTAIEGEGEGEGEGETETEGVVSDSGPPPIKKRSAHAEFIALWTSEYREHWSRDYQFSGGKDASAVSRLLVGNHKGPADYIEIAKRAWRHSGGFWCKQAASISGFASKINEIGAELDQLERKSNTCF